MATTIKSTDLDFDTIKNKLKDYIKSKDEFADYDFEGAALSNLLDVLAYNTHFNGLIANFAINESFLNTAQLRSSVVSHAEALGYVPTSVTSSRAFVSLSVTITDSSKPSVLTLPRGTTFSASIGNSTYTFRTLETYSATPDIAGIYQFKTSVGSTLIPVYEGTEKTKTFFVGEKSEYQAYVIPDNNADTNTLLVKVFDTATSSATSGLTYDKLENAVEILPNSRYYQVKETPNGYYEILFGDGVSTGTAPVAGNKIVVTYLNPTGPDANGATNFTTDFSYTINNISYGLNVTTDTTSAGGSFKESIESIRQNAPIKFASQQRLVTASDYRSQIASRYSAYLDDVIAWGGEDNVPPKFSTTFVGLKFKNNVSSVLQEDIKTDIVNDLTRNLAILGVNTEFVDAVNAFLEISLVFNLDPDLTTLTTRTVENNLSTFIQTYFTNNLNKFGKVFRRSNLLTEIDATDEAILNSRMSVKVQQRFTPVLNSSLSYTLSYPCIIAEPDDVDYRITSNRFALSGKTCEIRNRLKTNRLEIVSVANELVVDNIGYYDAASGKVVIEGFKPTQVVNGSEIKISVVPANDGTIRPLRNYILSLDASELSIKANLDFQTTELTL